MIQLGDNDTTEHQRYYQQNYMLHTMYDTSTELIAIQIHLMMWTLVQRYKTN